MPHGWTSHRSPQKSGEIFLVQSFKGKTSTNLNRKTVGTFFGFLSTSKLTINQNQSVSTNRTTPQNNLQKKHHKHPSNSSILQLQDHQLRNDGFLLRHCYRDLEASSRAGGRPALRQGHRQQHFPALHGAGHRHAAAAGEVGQTQRRREGNHGSKSEVGWMSPPETVLHKVNNVRADDMRIELGRNERGGF